LKGKFMLWLEISMLPAALILSGILTFTCNWLALVPWRHSAGQHWTERARLLHPARVSAATVLLFIPVSIGIVYQMKQPRSAIHWGFVVLFAWAGGMLGSMAMSHEIFPEIRRAELWRVNAMGWAIQGPALVIFLTAMAVMPDHLNVSSAFVGIVAIGLAWY
jgi:hypothetical protein